MSKRALLYVLLAGLFLVSSVYQARFIQRRLEYVTNPSEFVLNQIYAGASGRITDVSETAKAAGVREGDVLLAVEGRPFIGRGVLNDAIIGKRLGDPFSVTIRRADAQGSEPESITFPIGPTKGDDDLPTLGQWVFIIGITIWEIKKETTSPLEISAILFVGVTLIFASGRLGKWLIKWTDRRFFREVVNAEQVLNDLSEKVRTMVETKPLIETVASTISESLHVPRVVFLVNEDGVYKPAHALGYPEPSKTRRPPRPLR